MMFKEVEYEQLDAWVDIDPMLLRDYAWDALQELKRVRRAYGIEIMETEAILADALGYGYDDEYGWITGDHTIVTLAATLANAYREVKNAA